MFLGIAQFVAWDCCHLCFSAVRPEIQRLHLTSLNNAWTRCAHPGTQKSNILFCALLSLTPHNPLWFSLEYIFVITEELRLDPLVGYHAVELLER